MSGRFSPMGHQPALQCMPSHSPPLSGPPAKRTARSPVVYPNSAHDLQLSSVPNISSVKQPQDQPTIFFQLMKGTHT